MAEDTGNGLEVESELAETYQNANEIFKRLMYEIGKVVVGQREVVEQVLIAILTDSHALVEGNPGLAKTLIISTIARVMDLKFSRIQSTPDLMPSDITGTYIIEEVDGRKSYRFEPGPIFANIVLADELNRASPKTQSALLESMQERQVTVGNKTYPLERPFFVLATQNPIEQEGTYPLPEAQLDRFLLKILVGYPSFEEESVVVDRYTQNIFPEAETVLDRRTLLNLQRLTRDVPVAEDLKYRAIRIVAATRDDPEGEIEYGASPRASIGIILAAKARALMLGRNYVSREDINAMAFPVLRHRIILTFESERKGVTKDDVIERILKSVG